MKPDCQLHKTVSLAPSKRENTNIEMIDTLTLVFPHAFHFTIRGFIISHHAFILTNCTTFINLPLIICVALSPALKHCCDCISNVAIDFLHDFICKVQRVSQWWACSGWPTGKCWCLQELPGHPEQDPHQDVECLGSESQGLQWIWLIMDGVYYG